MLFEPGIYENIIDIAIDEAIASDDAIDVQIEKIQSADSDVFLSGHVLGVLNKGLKILKEKYVSSEESEVSEQVALCNVIIDIIANNSRDKDLVKHKISKDARRLLSVKLKASPKYMEKPYSPLSISSLFTGNKFEPQMVHELKKEILSSDSVDLLVSFIKNSGLNLLISEFEELTSRGGKLRVITTTYMGATDPEAVIRLSKLPNTEIKISYDSGKTRHHAKSYIFHRKSGLHTAYVGSSNLSGAAISGGLEWNVKLTNRDTAHLLRNIWATFESYWESNDFVTFTENDSEHLIETIRKSTKSGETEQEFLFDIEPYPHQKEVLEELEAEREVHGRFRNLIVSATGTGKTIISAFDYKRFCQQNPNSKNRLLFIAHREEILEQSLKRFRGILKDQNFGELFVGNKKPTSYDHLFMSIQTFRSKKFEKQTVETHFDFIIIDETHHGAADSYRSVLTYYKPKIMLGMTATPERMDGLDITQYFDGVIASEIRLAEAIDRGMLVPFQYFGVTDSVDASSMRFDKGRYNVEDLDHTYLGNLERVDVIYSAIKRYAPPIEKIVGLGFCASQKHAHFMAEQFNRLGMKSVAVTSESSESEREESIRLLKKGDIKFIFTVDLYNEGVDIPEINTVLFLRPTESLTIFIQQLGRGLRLHLDKEELLVLDFIGQANKNYRFENKFAALTSSTDGFTVRGQIENGFVSLPRGCNIQLERVAREHIINNIKNATVNNKAVISMITSYKNETGKDISFDGFLDHFGITPEIFYKKSNGNTFYSLCSEIGLIQQDTGIDKKFYSSAFSRITNIDSRRWISTLKEIFTTNNFVLSENEEQMLLMLLYSMHSKIRAEERYKGLFDFVNEIKDNFWINKELMELLDYKYRKIKFVDKPIALNFNNSLDLHCSYTRDQIMSSVGQFTFNKRHTMLEGVRYLRDKKTDILLVTIEKSEENFSPTTMYEDYAITDKLFHWQSQNSTSEFSETGKRYINQQKTGNDILLFVREKQGGIYTCLGKVRYVSHSGSKPMSIIWELEEPMPPWLFERASAVR